MHHGFYPRSFLKLLSLAFLAAALPLVVALVQAALDVKLLAERSREAVEQTARAARASRQLVDQAVALERVARQYLVLDDRTLLQDYDTLRGRFKATSSELSLLPLDEAQLTELNRTIDTEAALYERLFQGAKTQRVSLAADYAHLGELARGVAQISNAMIDRDTERLGQLAAESERLLWQRLGLMLLLGIGAASLAAYLIARPVRELDRAIRRLGSGDLERPVAVRGPEDLERLGQRLDWLRQRLAELEAEKTRFLRHVSHELKTPLTALREGAELLADGSVGRLEPSQQEVVGILQSKSRQLQALIERLLDTQRALDELGRLRPEPLALDVLVRKVAGEQALAAEARGIKFRFDLVSLTVLGDGAKLATVVDNLLSNAIKYSPPGGMIALSLQRQDRVAWLEVRDQGPGVPATDRERIFDWFYLGRGRPGESAGSVAGSGLGLAIARELAQAHHGRLEVLAREEGGQPEFAGACFRLTLPLSLPLSLSRASSDAAGAA